MKIKSKKIILSLSIAVLFLAAVGILIFQQQADGVGKTAAIYQDGKLIREVSLDNSQNPYAFTIESSDGGYNAICVQDGKIGVIDTDCPDKICQDMGMVSGTAYPISCLPHKLVIRILPESGENPDIDTIAR